MTDRDSLLALSTFPPFGPAHLTLLTNYFGSAKKVWLAKGPALRKVGLSEAKIAAFLRHRVNFNLSVYKAKLKSLGVDVILSGDANYPTNLVGLAGIPTVLYIRGKLAPQDNLAIAIVGARKMTSYGREVAEKFAGELATLGVTIVSGLARGVDTVAHKAALAVGGRTIAVVGAGLDTIYPPENTTLAATIAKSGCILSEYPLGYPARPLNFAARNRIISGVAQAVVVVEGQTRSGTLLTASHAADQGRTVFAVPGQITSPLSAAPHFLIKNGAKIAFGVEDIVQELDLQLKVDGAAMATVLPTSREEGVLLEVLANEPLHIDELARILTLPSQAVVSTLTVMELKGMVKSLGGGVYKKC